MRRRDFIAGLGAAAWPLAFAGIAPIAAAEAISEGHGEARHMDAELRRVLERAYPSEEARYFSPMSIGSAPETADERVMLILNGVKTLTSSAFWNYPDGKIPFVGALSVLLDGARRPRGIVETTRVEIMPFQAINEDMAQDYCAVSDGVGAEAQLLPGLSRRRPRRILSRSPELTVVALRLAARRLSE